MQVVGQTVVLEIKRKDCVMQTKNKISVVVLFIVLATVLIIYSSQGTSQTTPPLSSAGQQNEIAEMKEQIVALERRVNTLEERLADFHKYHEYRVLPLQPR